MSSRKEAAFKGFLCNIILFAVALGVYRWNLYYVDFLNERTQQVLLWLCGAYLLFGFPLACMSAKESKGLLVFRVLGRFFSRGIDHLRRYPLSHSQEKLVSKEEKTAMLFLLVKFYFTPIMLNFVFGNTNDVLTHWNELRGGSWTGLDLFINGWYPVLFSTLFFIDTLYFTFGYIVEHPFLRNTVRSVEPTFFGWVIALLCYPPFNQVPDFFFVWPATDFPIFSSLSDTALWRLIILLLLGVYVWATIALGPRSSNLTNRGIVSWGPYAIIRHPAYISKNLAWWMSALPFFMSQDAWFAGIIGMSAWSLIYFLRALTEERHLALDPDYLEYCEKVRYRFIPFLF
jgi:protein-S-isoprenylcysteine O-methyltransferase Ste14